MLLSGSKPHIGGATAEAMALAVCVVLLRVVTAITPLDNAVRTALAPLGSKLFSPTLPLWTFTITTGFLTVGLLALMAGRTHPDASARLPGLPAMCLSLVVAAVARLPHDSRLAPHHWVAHLDAQESLQQPLR
jgi:hypothetical protein